MTLTPRLARAAQTALLATTLATASVGCLAQAASSPAKKELVQKLVQLQQPNFEALARTLTEQPIAMMGQQASAILQNRVAPEQREALFKEIQAEFNKYADEVGPLVRDRALKAAPGAAGPILEEKLSEDELKQAIAALESPGFRKLMQLGPELQRALGQKLVTDLQPTIDPKIKLLEQSISKKLNAAAPAGAGPGAGAAAPKAPASGAKK